MDMMAVVARGSREETALQVRQYSGQQQGPGEEAMVLPVGPVDRI